MPNTAKTQAPALPSHCRFLQFPLGRQALQAHSGALLSVFNPLNFDRLSRFITFDLLICSSLFIPLANYSRIVFYQLCKS